MQENTCWINIKFNKRFNGGGQDPAKFDIIDYVTISTLGDATDFGDLTVARRFGMGLSDVHGGLG